MNRDGWLVANITLVNVLALGQRDLQHRHNTGELEVIEAFEEWLVLVDDRDVANLVDLMESLDSVLDELGQVHG